jgi:hypothetical protein
MRECQLKTVLISIINYCRHNTIVAKLVTTHLRSAISVTSIALNIQASKLFPTKVLDFINLFNTAQIYQFF